jgi:hypothetical protein
VSIKGIAGHGSLAAARPAENQAPASGTHQEARRAGR